MNCRVVVVLLSLLVSCLTAAVDSSMLKRYEQKITKAHTQTDSISALIKKRKRQIDSLKRSEGKELSALSEMEEALNMSEEYLKTLAVQQDSVTGLIFYFQLSIDSLNQVQHRKRELLKKRVVALHRRGVPSDMEILLNPSSIEEKLKQRHYIKSLNRYDQNLIRDIRHRRDTLETEQKVLELQTEELARLKEENRLEAERVAKQAEERRKLLAQIQREKRKWQNAVKELEEAQKALTTLVTTLASEKEVLTEQMKKLKESFEARRGKLLWPAVGDVTQKFGKIVHPEYKTVTRNNGIDIGAKKGASVLVVAPGLVKHVGMMKGYGKIVLVDHFGGYTTIYAHLSTALVKKGDEVALGKKIGTVGESGSLDGVKLHFEIRKKAKALDPAEWLLAK